MVITSTHGFTHTHLHTLCHLPTGPSHPTPQYEYTPQLKELDRHQSELPETSPLLKGAHHSPPQVAAWSAALRWHPDTEFVGYILEGMQLLGCQSDNQVYIDISLSFSLHSAPIIFTALADGLQWVIEQRGASYVAWWLHHSRGTQHRPMLWQPADHHWNLSGARNTTCSS